MAEDRVTVRRGGDALQVVADQIEHWESLGYTVETAAPKKRSSRRTAVKESDS